MNYFQSTCPDHLTVAYITMGYCNAIKRMPDDQHDRLIAQHEGQCHLIESVITHAGFVDFVFQCHRIDFDDVVFYYDVAEPFGQLYVEAVAKEKDRYFDPKALAISVLRSVLKEALSQDFFNRIFTESGPESQGKSRDASGEDMLATSAQSPETTIPLEVMNALDRMCTPLDSSYVKGVTAEEDARCMGLIRNYILRLAHAANAAEINAPNSVGSSHCGKHRAS
ncbi:MAG: hypothetical protein ACYCS8_01855 [Acidithiobacillus sp.]